MGYIFCLLFVSFYEANLGLFRFSRKNMMAAMLVDNY